jgi:hypothetical protein
VPQPTTLQRDPLMTVINQNLIEEEIREDSILVMLVTILSSDLLSKNMSIEW